MKSEKKIKAGTSQMSGYEKLQNQVLKQLSSNHPQHFVSEELYLHGAQTTSYWKH